jgi:hypothetical protein
LNITIASVLLSYPASVERLVVIGRRPLFQRTDVAATEILFWRGVHPSHAGFADPCEVLVGLN